MKLLFSPKCLEYRFSSHPESPERVSETARHLKESYKISKPSPAREEQVLLAHTKGLLTKVATGRFHDPDTPSMPEMYGYACLSAGSAIRAAQTCAKEGFAFSLMRPPGHHAGHDFLGGFCYFNNIAIAIKAVQEKNGMRIAILDIDCHFGNGTQDIFLGAGDVLCVSLHQRGIFPGTGLCSQGNCINFPLDQGTGEQEYLAVLSKAISLIEKFKPDMLGISAGFDTYELDPLCGLCLKKTSYAKIGQAIKPMGVPCFGVFEGGYSDDVKYCVEGFLQGVERR